MPPGALPPVVPAAFVLAPHASPFLCVAGWFPPPDHEVPLYSAVELVAVLAPPARKASFCVPAPRVPKAGAGEVPPADHEIPLYSKVQVNRVLAPHVKAEFCEAPVAPEAYHCGVGIAVSADHEVPLYPSVDGWCAGGR